MMMETQISRFARRLPLSPQISLYATTLAWL
jgi:hypothetical protein